MGSKETKKNFSNNNVFENFGNDNIGASEEPGNVDINMSKTPAAEPKKEKKYLRLDITDNQEYISLMADHNKVSMTKYINQLIEADKQSNSDTFKKLAEIERQKRELI